MSTLPRSTNAHANDLLGASVYVPGVGRYLARSDDTGRALERLVRSRGASATVIAAAVLLCHLRGEDTPNDAAMTLVDALIDDSAPRPMVIDAVRALGRERSLPLLRRALRMRRDAASVRDLATAMLAVAFAGATPVGVALTLEQHLALSTLAQHPTLWSHDTAWLAEHHLGATREAVARWVTAGA